MGRLTDNTASASGYAFDLRQWCDDHNRTRLAERMRRWYFVNDNEGTEFIDCLEGDEGENVRKLLDGEVIEFDGWEKPRMDGYRNWLAKCAKLGLAA